MIRPNAKKVMSAKKIIVSTMLAASMMIPFGTAYADENVVNDAKAKLEQSQAEYEKLCAEFDWTNELIQSKKAVLDEYTQDYADKLAAIEEMTSNPDSMYLLTNKNGAVVKSVFDLSNKLTIETQPKIASYNRSKANVEAMAGNVAYFESQLQRTAEKKIAAESEVAELQAAYDEAVAQDEAEKRAAARITSYTNGDPSIPLFGDEEAARAFIMQKESGGNYNAVNGRYQGAYQLDRSYLNGDYSPENQDRVAQQYVENRYGSWVNAAEFWRNHHWY